MNSRVNLKTLAELSKSGIVTLVLISVFTGYFAGHSFETHLDYERLLLTLFGVLFLASGSSALNQAQEIHIDRKMPRTQNRPLPSGRITRVQALFFSWSGIFGGAVLLWFVSLPVFVMGILAVVLYNGLYTLWWKPRWAYAAIPGAIPGALPILIGYTAANGEWFTPGGMFLFAILFFWQMPHFWVLAIRYSDDYAQGQIPTLPVSHGSIVTIFQIQLWCLGYIALALGGSVFIRLGSVYHAVVLVFSGILLWELYRYSREPSEKKWLRFFLWVNFSLIAYTGAVVADLWSIYLIR